MTFLAISTLLICICTQFSFGQSSSGKKFGVTIDAGHGGHDSGAPGKKSVEKNIALKIALKLGQYIENQMEDVNVFYTRKTDVFVNLYVRAQIANNNKSDVFISIHVNANKSSVPTGTSTYVMGFSRSAENLDLVMQENKAILLEKDYKTNYANFDPSSEESYILSNIVQNNNLTQSLEIATAVQDQFRIRGHRKDIGVHQGNLVVLWTSAKPSILVETGFISNAHEEEFLMSANGQDIIASCIFTAFREYKESVDSKMKAGEKVKKTGEEEKTAGEEVKKLGEEVKILGEKEKNVAEEEKREEEVKKIGEEKKNTGESVKEDEEVKAGVEYRVQVLASVKKLPPGSKSFKGVKGLKEIKLDGYYKYMSPPVKTFKEALELSKKLGVSFHGAFVVAFKNGERVPIHKKGL